MLDVFCGIDWAEDHHDIAVVDRDGRPAGPAADRRRRGRARRSCCSLLAEHGDSAERPDPGGDRDAAAACWSPCLRATGRPVYPINPMSVARYRDRHSVAGRKSDAGDALVLANILRTDLAAHRPLPADTELAQAIAVLARAQQDAVWDRTDAHNKLRSHLREYFPAILAAFASSAAGCCDPRPAPLLAAAPTPRAAAKLTLTQLRGTAATSRPQPRPRRRGRPAAADACRAD